MKKGNTRRIRGGTNDGTSNFEIPRSFGSATPTNPGSDVGDKGVEDKEPYPLSKESKPLQAEGAYAGS